MAYDGVKEAIVAELAEGPLGQVYKIEQVLPEPPGMKEYREAQAELARRRAEAVDEQNRAEAMRK